MALGHQHDLRLLTRPLACAEPSVVREAKNVTPDTGCCKAINPDIALGVGLGPDASMAPDGSTTDPD